MNRRHFLRASLSALLLPQAVWAQPAGYRRLLILVELKGGNDGLNTVVPHADDQYYRLRPRLALRDVLPLDARTGLHPALEPLLPLWKARELAIVQGVGYPAPNLSHFRSIEIWDTASKSDEYLTEGWLARVFAGHSAPREFAAGGVAVGGNDMGPLAGSGVRAIALSDPAAFLRRARLVSPAGKGYNSALNHILRVEADIAQAASRLHGGTSFTTEFPRGAFGNAVRVDTPTTAASASSRSECLTGLLKHASMPALRLRTASRGRSTDVNITIGGGTGLRAMRSATAKPSISGMIASRVMTAGLSCRASSRPSNPPAAVATWNPWD